MGGVVESLGFGGRIIQFTCGAIVFRKMSRWLEEMRTGFSRAEL